MGKDESIFQIRDRLFDKFDKLSLPRARTIAQTEVGRASGQASYESMKQYSTDTGIELRKEWVSARDDRVRTEPDISHEFMDGQVVDYNSSFIGPGNQMSLTVPPTGTGDAGFEINCRCIMAPLAEGEAAI